MIHKIINTVERSDAVDIDLAAGGFLTTGDGVVYTTGNQTISGNKVFLGNLTINNLTITGTETIVNTETVNIGNNYLLLNVTGGEGEFHTPASDAGIFVVTGNGLSGLNDSGAILGFDSPANKWVFGIGSRNSDLQNLNEIASVSYVNDLSGYVTSAFYTNDNPSGYITGISDFTYLSGDLTGSLLSPTIVKIQGNPVSSQPPANGQTLQWNGTSWVPGAIPAGGNGGGGRVYYFNFNNTSGINPTGGLPTTGDFPVSLLGRAYDIGSGQAVSSNLTPSDTDKLICGFVSASGNNGNGITTIAAGLWDFNIWASVDSQNATQSSIKTVLNIYNPTNSTYRKVAESDDVYLYDTSTPAQYIVNVTVPQTGMLGDERLYIEIYGKKYTSSSRVITLYFDSYRPSHVHTTIPSVVGNGVVKVVNGVFQSPATGIFDGDVDVNANIQQSKIQGLTNSLAALYPRSNPSGYITGVDLSSYYPKNNPSGFVTTDQLATGLTGVVQVAIGYSMLSANVAVSEFSGYLSSNPSGYITGVNLSAYALNANTGSFVTTAQTGAFYAASNPSGYIRTVNGTGVSNGGNVITGNYSVSSIVSLTQTQYNAITPISGVLYIIT